MVHTIPRMTESMDVMRAALRVLTAISEKSNPNPSDVEALRTLVPAPRKQRLAIVAHANCALYPFFRRIDIASTELEITEMGRKRPTCRDAFDSPVGYRLEAYRTRSSLRMKNMKRRRIHGKA
jgi:hypothetical protein